MSIDIPALHTRNMTTNWTPRSVVLHHLPNDLDDYERSSVRDGLLHWAGIMDAATTENGTELVRNCAGYGPAFDALGTGDRLQTARAALEALLRGAILFPDERACAEDLLALCVRYQVRLRILTRAMRQADNPYEPIDWMSEAP